MSWSCQHQEQSSDAVATLRLQVDGTRLVDIRGREVVLRGINVGGGAKLPALPRLRTDESGFRRASDIFFVDRPFSVADAPGHFARIAGWGFNAIRLVVSWEGIAHAGPDTIDAAYVAHVRGLAVAAEAEGLRVLIDFHQDVWSRWSGGDGAPHWTFAAAGLDVDKFATTGAAVLHDVEGEAMLPVQWPTNHSKLATATMFTLFFAGNAFAPDLRVADEAVQDFLQRQYRFAARALAERLADVDAVIGYDLMNEPGLGYIGLPSLDAWETQLTLGPMPTPAQSMFAGTLPQTVGVWSFGGLGFSLDGETTLNAAAESVWLLDAPDIWRTAGVWDIVDGIPTVLQDDHFATIDERPVDFVGDFLMPFYVALANEIAAVHPSALMFIETPAEANAAPNWPAAAPPAVFAPHWYDALSLISRDFNPEFNVRREPELELISGRDNVQALFVEQIAEIVARGHAGDFPVVIGEYGVPFDPDPATDARRAEALHMFDVALMQNRVGGFLWHYNPDHTRAYGDAWNLEDFSVIGQDDPEGRATAALIRPNAVAIAGELTTQSWDMAALTYRLAYRADIETTLPTEIAIPLDFMNHKLVLTVEGAKATRQGNLITLKAHDSNVELSLQMR